MEVINLEKAIRIMDGDKQLFQSLFQVIESTLNEKFENLEKALEKSNPEDVELYAHQFKGALRNVAAEEACSILEQIEKLGLKGECEKARELYPQVKPAVDRLLQTYKSGSWETGFR